ncbi:hypothetical protein AQ857_03500 [Burkholderia pseudomallei]|nr:hypothetical protein AQ858_22420 [Burkholderia pseudomallei]OMZ13129.1 hypothetical protein AQ857_03500 [Burkholderia pseudomallei]
MEREREDQNRYLAAQSAEIAGLKQRLAKQPNYCDIHCKKFCQNSVHGMCDGPPEQQQSVEVMEKKILELADKYRIDYGGDYSRNAKEHEFDLLAFVRAILPSPTQQPSGEVTPLKVERHSDMSVLVVFNSCRQASVFEREIAARAGGQ